MAGYRKLSRTASQRKALFKRSGYESFINERSYTQKQKPKKLRKIS
jgi:ribosomal protein L17